MKSKSFVVFTACFILAAFAVLPGYSQENRGKAEMKAGDGSIIVDYGRPSLQGRDMLAKLPVGQSWRMGMNTATTIATPVDLMFGSQKIAKGSYSLFLKKTSEDKFELLFNTQTGQWGTQHDAAKDIATVPMTMEQLSAPVETFTIDLQKAADGNYFVMTWGTMLLKAKFGM